ncbi:MAG: MBL fold metallo-hydrolase [Victivallales bacterium]
MRRKIITLGTSHGDPTYCRFNSATLILSGNKSYLIDAGAPVNALIIRHGAALSALQAVFITHMHDDHVGGLPGLIKSLAKYPVNGQHTEIFMPSRAAIEGLLGWVEVQHRTWKPELLDFKVTQPGYVFADNSVKITALPTRHLEDEATLENSFGYCFDFVDGFRLVYTGDLKNDFSDFPQIVFDEPCDICICESTHIDLERDIKALSRCSIGKIIFNHVADRWHGKGEDELLKLCRALPYECAVAHDGDEFYFDTVRDFAKKNAKKQMCRPVTDVG